MGLFSFLIPEESYERLPGIVKEFRGKNNIQIWKINTLLHQSEGEIKTVPLRSNMGKNALEEQKETNTEI